jgi:hypothetical protein
MLFVGIYLWIVPWTLVLKMFHNSSRLIIKSQKNENTGIAPLRSEGTLHSHPSEKANILNKQFQSAFTSEANTNIPDKGPSTHPTMEPVIVL